MTKYFILVLLVGLVCHEATTHVLPGHDWFMQQLFHRFSDNNATISHQGKFSTDYSNHKVDLN